ncbi:hypothetical protein IMX26_16945 [Clostridium sp. 'deep sea']|uniref:hypothetical protein n=1 Tax=Clostridium sp. 'deep sea' TaxID=2779445 RepID=UPI0018969A67|nr:hypothetical protein [Clostridium sp. 'deep sea']QOR35121.1 hypothetical protein IMX26_16945 [Clostridium sp. 'deep sea']
MKYVSKISIFILIIVMFITLGAFSSEKPTQIINTDIEAIIDSIADLNDDKNKHCQNISDYQPNKINEIPLTSLSLIKINNFKIYDAENPNSELKELIEVEEGYSLAFKQKQDIKGFKEREFYKPYIKKIDLSGKELWQLTIDNALQHLTIDYFKQLANGNLIISFSGCEANQQLHKKNNLTCISQQGEVLWKQSFAETCGSVIKHILNTENNDLLCVGICNTKNLTDKSSVSVRDIVITKINNNGVIVKQRLFGGNDYDDVHCIAYSKQFGLVIAGVTKSTNGDFKNRDFSDNQGFIARLDSNLNTIWYRLNKISECFNNNVLISDKYLYLTKHARDVGINSIGIIEKYNDNGDIVLSTKSKLSQKRFKHETLLPNGDFLIPCSNFIVKCSNRYVGDLLIYSNQGLIKKNYALNYSPQDIIPTVDGGFIIKSIRYIKRATLPIVVSLALYDTETIIEKYNNEYELEWCKSYDNYQDKLGTDFVLPLPSGKVIVQ